MEYQCPILLVDPTVPGRFEITRIIAQYHTCVQSVSVLTPNMLFPLSPSILFYHLDNIPSDKHVQHIKDFLIQHPECVLLLFGAIDTWLKQLNRLIAKRDTVMVTYSQIVLHSDRIIRGILDGIQRESL